MYRKNLNTTIFVDKNLPCCLLVSLVAEIMIMSIIEIIYTEILLFKNKLVLLLEVVVHFEAVAIFQKKFGLLRSLSFSGQIFEKWIRSLSFRTKSRNLLAENEWILATTFSLIVRGPVSIVNPDYSPVSNPGRGNSELG